MLSSGPLIQRQIEAIFKTVMLTSAQYCHVTGRLLAVIEYTVDIFATIHCRIYRIPKSLPLMAAVKKKSRPKLANALFFRSHALWWSRFELTVRRKIINLLHSTNVESLKTFIERRAMRCCRHV